MYPEDFTALWRLVWWTNSRQDAFLPIICCLLLFHRTSCKTALLPPILNQSVDQVSHDIGCYLTDYDLTTSRRGKPKIHHRGHFYINQYYSGPKAYRYWACVKRYCKGRLNMDKEGRIIVRGEHTHSVNDTGILFTVIDEADSSSNVEYLTPSNHSKVEKIILKTLQRQER